MTNLAKYPASTVQILGAEKALFRFVFIGFIFFTYKKTKSCSVYIFIFIIFPIQVYDQILTPNYFSSRALKTKGKTPKYGLIFHSSFIGRAAAKNKGRISRYLANKCSIASRIDCFTGIFYIPYFVHTKNPDISFSLFNKTRIKRFTVANEFSPYMCCLHHHHHHSNYTHSFHV